MPAGPRAPTSALVARAVVAARREWMPISIVVAAIVCYANAVLNSFALDDNSIIVQNPLVHHLSAVWRAFALPYWPNHDGGQYRPLAVASFAVDWAISHGHPWWFHLVNVAWHVAACLLVWRVLATMLTPVGAWLGAMWFALQPVHVEAVSTVVGRLDLMAAAFVLAAWLAHRHGRWTAVVWYVLALASKESGIVFLGLAISHDLLVGGPPRQAFTSRRRLYDWYGLVTAIYAVVLLRVFRHEAFVAIAPTWRAGVTAAQRLLTAFRVVPEYARLMLAPVDLKMDYAPRVIDVPNGLTPVVLLGVALTLAAVAVAVLARRRAPAVAFGVLAFALAVAPVSNLFFASGVVLAERTLYLPSVGIAIIVGWLLERGVRLRPRLVATLAACVWIGFAVRVWTRTPQWRDNGTLLLTQMQEQPESYHTHQSAGNSYLLASRWGAADSSFRIARELFSADPGPYIGGAEAALGLENCDRAAELLDSAIRRAPRDVWVYLRLSEVRLCQRRWRAAIASALGAYELAPDSLRAIALVATAAKEIPDVQIAADAYRRALADHPGDRQLQAAYTELLHTERDTAGARRVRDVAGATLVARAVDP